MNSNSRQFFLAGITCLIMACIFGFVMAAESSARSAILAGAILFSLALRHSASAKSFIFTLWIVVAVFLALVWPAMFVEFAGVELKSLIIPLLMLIMYGMGCTMSFNDFRGVIRMPKGVAIGVTCQFTIMPITGAVLASASKLPPEIAAGIILVGCSPSGLASNVMSYLAGANLALSLTLTAVATLLSPIMTPLLMSLLAGELIEINGLAMFYNMLQIVILPVVAGLFTNHFCHHRIHLINRIMPLLSMVGIILIIAIITAAGRDAILTIGFILIAVVCMHNLLGYGLGYGVAKLAGVDEQSARTISFEVGMQNSGLASGIALTMGKMATMGLAPIFFSPFMNMTGSTLASYWRRTSHPPTTSDK